MTVLWPNGSTRIPYVTSEFGPRDPIPGVSTSGFHSGIDLIGFAINKSPVAGVVIMASYNGGAGNEVRIRADNGNVFRIFHNARFLVSVGQRVAMGQNVGVMGTTGASTGVHCHFETHPGGGAAVNPRGYMAQANTGTAGGGDHTPIEEDDMFTDSDRENLTRAANVQPLHTRVIRNTGSGDIVMLHPAGIAIIGQPMIEDIASANGQALMAGQPLNAAGGYWIDLAPDRFGWELSRHARLLDALDARIRDVVGSTAGSGTTVDISDEVRALIPTPEQIAAELSDRLKS